MGCEQAVKIRSGQMFGVGQMSFIHMACGVPLLLHPRGLSCLLLVLNRQWGAFGQIGEI